MIFTIENKVFKSYTKCFINEDKKTVNKYLKKIKSIDQINDDEEGCLLRIFNGRLFDGLYVEKLKNVYDISTLSHEITHLVVDICEHRQIPIYSQGTQGDLGSETISYLQSFYMEEILNKFNIKIIQLFYDDNYQKYKLIIFIWKI